MLIKPLIIIILHDAKIISKYTFNSLQTFHPVCNIDDFWKSVNRIE